MTKNELSAIIGVNIKKHRKAQGITQEILAERAGISTPYCAQLEAGDRSMSIIVLDVFGK